MSLLITDVGPGVVRLATEGPRVGRADGAAVLSPEGIGVLTEGEGVEANVGLREGTPVAPVVGGIEGGVVLFCQSEGAGAGLVSLAIFLLLALSFCTCF